MALRAKDKMWWLQRLVAAAAIATCFRYSCLRYGTHNMFLDPFVIVIIQIIAVVSESPGAGPTSRLHNHIVLY